MQKAHNARVASPYKFEQQLTDHILSFDLGKDLGLQVPVRRRKTKNLLDDEESEAPI